jgi:hypothetical protein
MTKNERKLLKMVAKILAQYFGDYQPAYKQMILDQLSSLEEPEEEVDERPRVLHVSGKDLDSVGAIVGIPPRDKGESDDAYRKKILEKAYTEKPWIG